MSLGANWQRELGIGKLGLPIRFAPQFEDTSFTHTGLFVTVLREHPLGQEISEKLADDERVQQLLGQPIVDSAMGWHALQPKELDLWWLWRANMVGPEQAIDDLERYLDEDEIELISAHWVYGMRVTAERQISEEYFVTSPELFNDCADKEDFLRVRTGPLQMWATLPTAVVFRRFNAPKIFNDEYQERSRATAFVGHHICEMLNCIEGVACEEIYSSEYRPPQTPLGPFGGSGGGSGMSNPHGPVHDVDHLDLSEAVRLVDGLNAMSTKQGERFRRAVRRLTSAKTTSSLENAAIDLGIALEMLLLSDIQKGEHQLSNHFRMRGAWLLGKTWEERGEIATTLRTIYDNRSKVAHGGEISTTGDNTALRNQRASHEQMASRIFQRIALDGFPNWNDLVLGKNNETSNIG